jgi:hypothetical protein
MRELLRYLIPGLVVVAPLHLFVDGWETLSWPVWTLAALPIGLVLGQAARWRFEHQEHGYRSPRRPAIALIIERVGLAPGNDSGDRAYQIYETVFYQRQEWAAARDHAHRCWEWIFLFQATALGCAVGTAFSLLAFASGPHRLLAALLLAAQPACALLLIEKAQHTEAALHLFDRALVEAHWPYFEAVAHQLTDSDKAR